MVIRRVRELLAQILGADMEVITADMPLTRGSGVEPMDIAKLVIACEQVFGVPIQDEDVHAFRCPDDLAAYIDRLIDEGLANKIELTDEDRLPWFYE